MIVRGGFHRDCSVTELMLSGKTPVHRFARNPGKGGMMGYSQKDPGRGLWDGDSETGCNSGAPALPETNGKVQQNQVGLVRGTELILPDVP